MIISSTHVRSLFEYKKETLESQLPEVYFDNIIYVIPKFLRNNL